MSTDTTTTLFEAALFNHVRFQTTKGDLAVEDLFYLSHENLNTLYRALKSQEDQEDGLFDTRQSKKAAELTLKIGIVERVAELIRAQETAARSRSENKAKREMLMQIRSQKQLEAIGAKNLDELDAMIDELED